MRESDMRRAAIVCLVAAATGVLTAGCDNSDTESPPGGSGAAANEKLPDGLMLSKAPEGAKDVAEIKKGARAGDRVVVRGRIGGRRDPFVQDRAMFTICDRRLKSCREMDMGREGCPTPWDYCCENPRTLQEHTATIQIVDAGGRPLKLNVNGKAAIEPLARVVIDGKVAAQSDAANLVLNATGIFVEGP